VKLEPVADRVQELGAALVLDLSQSAGAMPLDLERLRPDFLVAVGYKWLLGPFSLGYLYVDERHRDGIPLEHNWIAREGADDFAALVNYTDQFQPGARRFDVGERTNFVLTPMAIAGLEQILDWSVPRVAAALAELTGEIEARARERGLDALPAERRGPHMIGIELPAAGSEGIVSELAAREVHTGLRSTWLRIAPHLHTTEADVEQLFAAIDAVGLGQGPG
jgi:selenocysteine lyase/cysteine desulfurase